MGTINIRFDKLKRKGKAFVEAGAPASVVVLLVVAFIALGIGLMLGIYWVFWSLWIFVIPQLFPTAPEVIQAPSYWLFVTTGILMSWLRKVIFGSKSTETTVVK